METMENSPEMQNRKSRELNLVIFGIPHRANEDPCKAVSENVFKKMRLVPKANFRAFRLGHGNLRRPAPMMVKFQDASRRTALESRRLVMNNKSALKGTPIRINPDLTDKQLEALPRERKKVQQAREGGQWSELREGVAFTLGRMRPPHTCMHAKERVMEHPQEQRSAESSGTVSSEHASPTEDDGGIALHEALHSKLSIDEDVRKVQSRNTEMGWSNPLPEHLVEKIVAMMPFPSIFKARGLSKSWLARFSPVSSLDDEENKGHAILFQKLVRETSKNWQTFCVVWINNYKSFAFNQTSHEWQRLPSLSFRPWNLELYCVETDGSLLHGLWHNPSPYHPGPQLWVINILTRSRKILPPRPKAARTSIRWKKLITHTFADYRMLLLCESLHQSSVTGYSLQTYDSSSDTWSTKNLVNFRPDFRFSLSWDFYYAQYFNGILYVPGHTFPGPILAINVEDGTFEQHNLLLAKDLAERGPGQFFTHRPLACTTGLHWTAISSEGWSMFTTDLKSLLLQVALSPCDVGGVHWPTFYNDKFGPGYGFGCFPSFDIYLEQNRHMGHVLTYNVEKDKWSFVPIPGIPTVDCARCSAERWGNHATPQIFQPGLNPFMEV